MVVYVAQRNGSDERSVRASVPGLACGEWDKRVPPAPRRSRSEHVRTVYRPRKAGRRPGARRSPDAQPQLHRHRAHPARPDPRGRRRCRQGARVARHLARRRPPAGRGDHRPGPAGAERPHSVHAASEEGPRAQPARGVAARSQLHRHRAHPARPDPRGRRRRRAGAGQARRRPQPGAPAGHPAALRLPGQGAGRGRRAPAKARRAPASCSTSSAATSPRPREKASSTRSSAGRRKSSASCRCCRGVPRTTRS